MNRYLLLGLITFAAGFVTSYKTIKPEVRTEIREVKVKEVVTVVRELKREERKPDGTITIITDTTTDKRSDTRKDNLVINVPVATKLDWSVGAYTDGSNFLIGVDRRILGDFYLGAYVRYEPVLGEVHSGVGIRYNF